MGTEAEVLECLSGVLGASEKQGVASSGGSESELIEGQGLSTSSHDAGTGGSGEAESSNAELGDRQETVVISDGTDNNDGLVVGLLGSVGDDSRDRDGRSVDAGHKEAAQDDLVEGGVGSAWIESASVVVLCNIR